MKKTILLATIAFTAIINGCSKFSQLANINVDIPYSSQASVPPVQGYTSGVALPSGGVDLPSVTVGIATNSKAYLSQYGTAANMIVSVDLKSLAIQIQSPSNQNFDFLDNVQVYLSANDQPEVQVVSDSNIPKGSTTLNLTTNTTVNLKNYYTQDTIYLRLAAHINAVPTAGEQLNISSVFHLVANPLQ
jgi:hypothetical protein